MTKYTVKTKQEAFDVMALHLLTQDKRSEGTTGFCAYRGLRGLKCAVGPLIPDSEYTCNLEDVTVTGLREKGLIQWWPRELDDFLNAVQLTHDRKPVGTWRKELETIALEHHLNYDCVTNFNKVSVST